MPATSKREEIFGHSDDIIQASVKIFDDGMLIGLTGGYIQGHVIPGQTAVSTHWSTDWALTSRRAVHAITLNYRGRGCVVRVVRGVRYLNGSGEAIDARGDPRLPLDLGAVRPFLRLLEHAALPHRLHTSGALEPKL